MTCFINKYKNTSRQRSWTFLRLLGNSVKEADANPDVFLSEFFQLRDKLSDLGELVSNKRLTTFILDALSKEKYFILKVRSIGNPDLGLEEITSMMKTIFINHSERSLVPKSGQESYRKSRDSGREPTMNGR